MSSEISISDIRVTPWNPRKAFDPEELLELQQSIQQYGILEPLIVRPAGEHYELVAGERRFRAAAAAGLQTVPVVIKDLTDAEVHEIMLIENLQRSQLAPLEEASSLQVLLEQGGLIQADLAGKLGKSQAWIANRLRLLQAPEELKTLLISREISPKHVIAALPYSGYPVMTPIVQQLQEKIQKTNNVSVNELNQIIKSIVTKSYDNEFVFCIDDVKFPYREFQAHMDFSNCQGCKHIVVFRDYRDIDERYCLDRRCWKNLVNKAKNLYDKEREKALAKMAKGSEVVDTSKLSYTEYTHMYGSHFDLSSCHACEKCRKDKHDSLICLDPKCYKKKQVAHTKQKNKARRSERERVWNAVDSWIDSKPDLRTEWVLRCLIYSSNEARVKSALSKWGKLKSTSPYIGEKDVDEFISSIPADDMLSAVIRVLCADRLEQYESVTLEQLKRFVPDAVSFYVPPEVQA